MSHLASYIKKNTLVRKRLEVVSNPSFSSTGVRQGRKSTARMRLLSALCLAASASSAAVAAMVDTKPEAWSTFVRNTISKAPNATRFSYPRQVQLSDGTLLVTASLFGPPPAYFPVFESKDGGATWDYISNITDQVNGWGMSAQPSLLELTEKIGDYDVGTILASGNSWSSNGTRLDVYASKDKARTWEFVSRAVEGGRPSTADEADPVWEPFLMLYEHQIVVFYSDQRDPEHSQKLAHQVSSDLKNWGPVVNDVRYDDFKARPGMTVVEYVPPINKYMLVYESPNSAIPSTDGQHYPVHYRLADSPLLFDSAPDYRIVINGNFSPNASPYVVWTPVGGPNGTIIVSDADYDDLYTNTAGGDPNKWVRNGSPQSAAYARSLHVFKDRPDNLAIIGGDTFDGSDPDLTLSVVSVNALLANETDVAHGPR
ncbi:BNR/Asp-box repeat domain-containing protein [Magnaporthiopsis poae ATCC 64411]|uniref:BNR/Asp-box repeat domain-containing protein n=1 Tax=Magnaporthiopsis poae (strain ATCC 64411 / 73-15) TaxID=644358 RepID=A0A0C4EGM7_MAGP6|nr:BNR/Asp-box repeat domain-containing protein [Magnaporthiopsis poae ATCC 64411]